jgi:glycosyltransferase involved in cell wall biosynthesis
LEDQRLKIAVPWSLSHYIPLNGFHPLYRALFDHMPGQISLSAWDNVKLHQHFAGNLRDRGLVASSAVAYKRDKQSVSSAIESSYADYFYPPDRVLTEALPGEVEFHHTAPFPSLTRPFVFHCESFAPVFFPFGQQGHGSFEKHRELRLHYKRIFGSPLCQGIYSHIPGTLDSLSTFFSDPAIEAKLFGSKIGLSKSAVDPCFFRARKPVDKPRFLFINSAHQRPTNFFNRGGHVVLRFWKAFIGAGREGKLILRCGRPDDATLASYGVDPAFVRSELGRSILWAEGYLSNHEINALMADAHFFLLPSASLHSASILLAMTLGTVPIVTDTLGTSVYVTDRDDAIVLKGVKDEIWHLDPNTGVLVDNYERMPNVANSLVTQLVERVFELLNSNDTYLALSHRAAKRARIQFSGEAFASDFWESVATKAEGARTGPNPSSSAAKLAASLQNCTLDPAAWARVFESSTQPMQLLDTGTSTVFELSGSVVHMTGNTRRSLTDWSVFAQYFESNPPEAIFANTLIDLGNAYLHSRDDGVRLEKSKLVRYVSRALAPFPALHSLAFRCYRMMLKVVKFAKLWLKYRQYKSGRIESDDYVELVMENIHNFNVIRSFHKYYAIPSAEGPFIVAKAEGRLYSRTFCAYSLKNAVKKVHLGRLSYTRRIANNPIVAYVLHRIGEDRVRSVIRRLKRKQLQGDGKSPG